MKPKIEEKWFKQGIEIGGKIALEHEEEFKFAIENSPSQYRNLLKEFLTLYKENDFWKDTLAFELRKDIGNNLDYEPSMAELIDEMESLEGKFNSGFYTGIVKYLQSEKLI